jgi:hypothetical protein
MKSADDSGLKRRNIRKTKINKLATNSKEKNIREPL